MTRSAPIALRPLFALMALALTIGGCSFDTAGLDDRLCTTAIDCPVGQTCEDGICIGSAGGDVAIDGGGDTDSGSDDVGVDTSFDTSDAPDGSDASIDVGPDAGECEPGTAVCEGNVVLSCTDDATIERVNCLSVSNCPDGEFGCFCDDGACEPRVCSPGTERCADEGTVETCTARGDAYETSATCTDDEICIGAACVDRLCEAGTSVCSGETIVECNDSSQISDTIDCLAEGAWCDDRGDTPICTPRACTPGEVRCAAEGEAVEVCDARGTGFEPPTPCEGATFCDDGLCEDQICDPGFAACLDAFSYEICDARGARVDRVTCDDGDYCDGSGDLPTCLPQACEPGTTVCAGGREAVRTCTPSGAAYTDPVDCGDDQFCAGGVCNDQVCEPGDRACDGLFSIRTCDGRGAGVTITTCAEGRYCDDDGAAPTCAPQVCTPGATRCDDGGVSTCDDAGSGFGDPVACGSDQICLSGACEDVVCEAGTATCTDEVTRSACNATGTTLTTERCGAEQFCEDGRCEDWICTPGTVTCFDTTGLEICNEFGSALGAVLCGEGQSCADGECIDRVCEPGVSTCTDGDTFSTCADDGLSASETDCGGRESCSDGACEPWICAPGETSCGDADTVLTCSGDGLAETPTDCGASETCSRGECTPWVCTPGEASCVDDTTEGLCSDDGLTLSETSCAADETCVDGACEPDTCAVGTLFCDGDDLVRCTSDGEDVVETCALGCADGACVTGCGDGIVQAGESCDDGNDDPCDGCDACQIDGALQMDPGETTTTSPGNWTPGTSDLTLEAWVLAGGEGLILGVGEAGFDHALLRINASGQPVFSVSLDPGQANVIIGPDAITDGDWHHIAGVRFDEDVLWLFVDGQFVAATTRNLTSASIDRGQLWVGDYASEPGSPARARIGDARVSNSRRYVASFAPPRSHPADGSTIAAWQFDDATDTGGGTLQWASTPAGNDLIVRGAADSASCYGAPADAIACGDDTLAPWEVCDDGNTTNGDGCNDACMIECSRSIGPFHNCYDWNVVAQTWVQWRNTCRSRGAELITLETALEDYWVRLWVFENFDSLSYWVGLNDRDTEGTFEWVSGSDATFRLWAGGEPNDSPPGEDCTQVFPTTGWNDITCSVSLNSICEYPTD